MSNKGVTKYLSYILYVLEIKRNLLSLMAIMDHVFKAPYDKTGVEILNFDGVVFGRGSRKCNNIYQLAAYTTNSR